jgi:DNA replication protein DnaD
MYHTPLKKKGGKMSKQGWVSVHRKLLDNPIWASEPFTRGQAWVDLLLLANHAEGMVIVRDNVIKVKRGQVGWSQRRLAQRWQWSRTKVRAFLKLLEKEQQIKQHKSNIFTLIYIVNYNKYQQKEPQTSPQEYHRKATGKPQEDTNNKKDNGNNVYKYNKNFSHNVDNSWREKELKKTEALLKRNK